MPLEVINKSRYPLNIEISFEDNFFTEREKDIILLVVQGHKNRAIACNLRIGEGAVRSNLTTIYSKLTDTIGLPSERVSDRGLFFLLLEGGFIDLINPPIKALEE